MTDTEAEAIAREIDPAAGGFFRKQLATAAKKGAERAVESLRAARPAINNLLGFQRQLDMDGVEVGVSRQALDELLTAVTNADGSHR